MDQAQIATVGVSVVQFNQPLLGPDTKTLPMTSVSLDLPLPPVLDPPITLTWAVTDPATAVGTSNYTASCVWWQWDGLLGNWSAAGCSTAATPAEVRCLCTHLTEFSVALVPRPNLVSASDFTNTGRHIVRNPSLICLQGAVLLLCVALMVLGYVRDKRAQVCGRLGPNTSVGGGGVSLA